LCLPVSRLFWVSSLAYPNLLGTKGYVVVVVIALVMNLWIQGLVRKQRNSHGRVDSWHTRWSLWSRQV